MRHSLPEGRGDPGTSKPTEIPYCLDSLARLEIIPLTREDIQKTAMYAQERLVQPQFEQLAELVATRKLPEITQHEDASGIR
ncbi:MAG: hypothetical protein R3E50_13735 [Halioglobus sp.]